MFFIVANYYINCYFKDACKYFNTLSPRSNLVGSYFFTHALFAKRYRYFALTTANALRIKLKRNFTRSFKTIQLENVVGILSKSW